MLRFLLENACTYSDYKVALPLGQVLHGTVISSVGDSNALQRQ